RPPSRRGTRFFRCILSPLITKCRMGEKHPPQLHEASGVWGSVPPPYTKFRKPASSADPSLVRPSDPSLVYFPSVTPSLGASSVLGAGVGVGPGVGAGGGASAELAFLILPSSK